MSQRPWRVWLEPDQYEMVGPDGRVPMTETMAIPRRVRARAFVDEDVARNTAHQLAARYECVAIVEYVPTGFRTEVRTLW